MSAINDRITAISYINVNDSGIMDPAYFSIVTQNSLN